MKRRIRLSLAVLALVALDGWASPPLTRFQPIIPTVKQEAAYVWRNLQNIRFFEANAYEVSFPTGEPFAELMAKAKADALSEDDYGVLLGFMSQQVYRRDHYTAAYEKVVAVLPELERMLDELLAQEYPWGFRAFSTYPVVLTLFGPGGSYSPDDGAIILFATRQGGFRQYESPLNTLIHETVHIGIEESIVRRYALPHGTKERLVDTIFQIHFGDVLPEYRVQRMGNPGLDERLDGKGALRRLPEILEALAHGEN